MTTSTLKNKINKAIELIEDEEFLKAVYVLINNKSKSMEYIYPAQLKNELEESSALYKAGKSKTFTLSEVVKKVEKNLSKTFTIITKPHTLLKN